MVEFTLVISDPETRKAIQKKISDMKAKNLIGKRIGDQIRGTELGLPDSMLQITGGTDRDGFPMRGDIHGPGRKRILLASGPGFRPREKGHRKKKTVRGDVISEDVQQINVKIIEKRDRKGFESLFTKFFEEKGKKKGE